MILQPIISWWAIAVFVVASLSLLGWQFSKNRATQLSVNSMYVRQVLLFVMTLLMIVGISVPGGTSSPGITNIDVVFAIDTTASMGAEDYGTGKTRLQGAKNDMIALQSKLRGATMSIVTFDSQATIHQPFSADSQTFLAAVDALRQEIDKTSKGTSIDKPISTIEQQLKNSQAVHPERTRLLFFLSDGEQTNSAKVKSFNQLTKYINGGAVLGYGTSKGAKIRRFKGLGISDSSSLYINTIDPATKKLVPAISKLSEPALTAIAKDLKVVYSNRNSTSLIDNVFRESKAPLLIEQGRKVTHYSNLYWLFASVIVVLLFWELQRVARQLIAFSKKEELRIATNHRKKRKKREGPNV